MLTNYTAKIERDLKNISKHLNSFISLKKINTKDRFAIFNGRLPIENAINTTLGNLKFKNIIYHESNNFKKKIYFWNFKIHN